MIQRSIVWRAWLRSRNDRIASPKNDRLRQFFDEMEAHPGDCWDALVPTLRSGYDDVMEEIVTLLISTDDPLIIYNLFRFADFGNARELRIIHKFILNCDAERHRCTLQFLSGFKACESELRQRGLLDCFAPSREQRSQSES
jgi:hypothetical protein